MELNFTGYNLYSQNAVERLIALAAQCEVLSGYWDVSDEGEEYWVTASNTLHKKSSFFAKKAKEVARSWQSRQRNDDMDVYCHYKHSSSTAEVF